MESKQLSGRNTSPISTHTNIQVCLLLEDRRIVDTHWNLLIEFKGAAHTAYFISIRHYNHLEMMTAKPVNLSGSPLVGFTDPVLAVLEGEKAGYLVEKK